MPISDKQLAANRRNAQLSTGPRTPAGKVISSRNALTTGLHTAGIVLTFGPHAESEDDFAALLADLHRDLSPVGPVEEHLVARIASCSWRLRRIHHAESGAIAHALESTEHDHHTAQHARLRSLLAIVQNSSTTIEPRELRDLATFSLGLQYLITILDRAISLLHADRAITNDLTHLLRRWVSAGTSLGLWLAQNPLYKPDPSLLPSLLNALAHYRAELASELAATSQREARSYHIALDQATIPSPSDLDRILRYETTLTRTLDRALTQLHTLQHRRIQKSENEPISPQSPNPL